MFPVKPVLTKKSIDFFKKTQKKYYNDFVVKNE